MTWWQSPRFAAHLDDLSKYLPDCLVKFLQQALHPGSSLGPDEPLGNTFYLSRGLATPDTLWGELLEDMGDGDRVALYLTDYEISDPSIDGIVYDVSAHCCVFNSYPYNEFVEEDKTPIWQYLETVLTAWINMIERKKAAVVPSPFTNYEPDAETGVVGDGLRYPWGWASYTRSDIDETVEAWHDLISAINKRLPESHIEPLSNCPGVFEASDLAAAGITEDSFAWHFYHKARRPHFRSLGPGNLQLPSIDQLVNHPFEAAWKTFCSDRPSWIHAYKPSRPLPILLGQSHTEFWSDEYGSQIESLPWGLYFDLQRNPSEPCPYEDGSRLALPELRQNSPLRRLDGQQAGHADLYQVGQNPFEPDHSTQLRHMLAIFTAHVEDEDWRIDENGVSEPVTVFEDVAAQMDPDGEEAEGMRFETVYRMYMNCDT